LPTWPRRAASASTYIANSGSRIVHRAECKQIVSMKPGHAVGFDHFADALAEGYKPCRYCLRAAAITQTEGETAP